MKQNRIYQLAPYLGLFLLPLSFQAPKDAPAESKNTKIVVRNPTIYNADTSDLADRLVEKLEKASSREVLRWAVEQIGKLGDEAIPALRRAFYKNFTRAEYFPAVSNLCDALGSTRSTKALPILVDALTHPSGLVRSKAIDAIGILKRPEAFEFLKALLMVESKEYRIRLFKGLASTGAPEFIDMCLEIWETESVPIRELLLQSVYEKYQTERGKEFLQEIFKKPLASPYERALAALGLSRFGDQEAVNFCEKIAATMSAALPERVCGILGLGFGRRYEHLIPYSEDADMTVRFAVIRGVSAGLANPFFQEGNTPKAKSAGLDLLKKLAQDSLPNVRLEAIRALIAENDHSVLDPYLGVIRDEPDPDKLKEALDLVIDPQILEVRAIPVLIERMKKGGDAIKRMMMQTLGGLHDSRGVEPLIEILVATPTNLGVADSDEFAAMQLGFLGNAAVKPLIELDKKNKDPRIHQWTIQAMIWTRSDEAIDYLVKRIEDQKENRELRLMIVRQIPSFAKLETAGQLKRILNREPDPEIRQILNDILWDYF